LTEKAFDRPHVCVFFRAGFDPILEARPEDDWLVLPGATNWIYVKGGSALK
jgi:hypothetical protein